MPAILITTRPDGAVFVAASVVATAMYNAERTVMRRARELLVLYGPSAVIVVLVLLWKRIYYGDFLPNTYYAKAAYLVSWDAGLAYLKAFIDSYPHVLLMVPLALVGALASQARPFTTYAALACLAFTTYVAKTGGDFMHYRFMFEVYPLFVSLTLAGLVSVASFGLAPALACGVVASLPSAGSPVMEHKFAMQSLDTMHEIYLHGRLVGTALGKNLPADTVISTGLAGTMSYFSNLQNIDELGLNDRRVARLPVTRIRFRGHVKHAPVSYMEERGVNLAFWHPDYHSCSSPPERDFPSVFIRVDEKRCVRARYLVQSAKLTELFCAHRGQFVLSGLVCPDALPVPSLTEGYESIDQVVYREGHYIDGTAFRFDVHDPDWVTTGEAFEGWPSAPSSAQGSIYGPIGGFLNSFHPTKGDRARGSIESPPFDIIGDVLVLRVGGGNLEAKLHVELLIEGKRVARITGNNTRTLQPHFIDVADHKGKVGVLKVVDQGAGSFGHIMVDEVVQWRRAVPGPT